MKTNTLLLFLLVINLSGCDYRSAREDFDRQIAVCSVAEGNGLLDAAVQACVAALTIAEVERYERSLISGLLYKLGRLERQRNKFTEAELLLRRSLALEEQSGDQGMIATRRIELSLSVAGQGRWMDGAKLLDDTAHLMVELTGDDRKAAINAFRLFSVRLSMRGYNTKAEQFKAKAQKLAGS